MERVSIYIQDIRPSAGTERAVVNLANNLSRHNFDVELLSLYSASGSPFFELDPKVKLTHLNLISYESALTRIFYSVIVLFRLYRSVRGKNGILIGSSHSINIILAIVKMSKKQNKYIGCEHLDYDAAKSLTKKARALFYPLLDSVVVLTHNDYLKYLERDQLRKCFIIQNQISFYPDKLPCYSNKNILAIGRYTEQKGFDLLIDAIKDILLREPEWRLTIIGEGEMKSLLKKMIVQHNLESQIFLKSFTNDILSEFLDSSIYIMTSRYEGLPMVLLEAKACGLPIISYDCPSGPKELIIDKEDGFLIPFKNVELLQEHLLRLISNSELREKMGLKAKRNALDYSPEYIFRKWKNLFDSL